MMSAVLPFQLAAALPGHVTGPRFSKDNYVFNFRDIELMRTAITSAPEEMCDGRIHIIHKHLNSALKLKVTLGKKLPTRVIKKSFVLFVYLKFPTTHIFFTFYSF